MHYITYDRNVNGSIVLKYDDVKDVYKFYTFKQALAEFKRKHNLKYKRCTIIYLYPKR